MVVTLGARIAPAYPVFIRQSLQQRLAQGEAIQIFNPDRGVLAKPLLKLSFAEIATVIRNGHVLTADEQRAAIARRPLRQARKSKIIEMRLDAETYTAAAAAAAAEGVTVDRYLRSVILRHLGAS